MAFGTVTYFSSLFPPPLHTISRLPNGSGNRMSTSPPLKTPTALKLPFLQGIVISAYAQSHMETFFASPWTIADPGQRGKTSVVPGNVPNQSKCCEPLLKISIV
jgi:hypothetical protein